MYKICKTEQSATRQRELEQTLLKQMQLQRFEDIAISDLCESAGIPRKAFYRYFSGKHGALHALIDHTLMDFEGNLPESHKDLLYQLELFFTFWARQKPLLDAIERSSLWEELTDLVIEYSAKNIARHFQYSGKQFEEHTLYSMRFTIGGVMTVVRNWYHDGFRLNPNLLAAMITSSIAPNLDWFSQL